MVSIQPAGAAYEVSRVPGAPAALYLDALLDAKLQEAEAIVRQEIAHGLDHIYTKILQPALYEVGRLWEASQLSVAQEHFCTAATQQIMASLYAQIHTAPKQGRRLLATSIGGNFHAVGIRMLSDVFALAGWETRFLGADSSGDLVCDALAATPCDVLALSAALKEHVPAVQALIARLRSSVVGEMPWILVGGRAFNDDPGRWREVGADGHAATPAEAVELANRLLETGAPAAAAPIAFAPSAEVPSAARTARPGAIATPSDEALLAAMSRLNNQLHDVTRALADNNAELGRVNEQLNRMMGMAAHDLRSPLMIIQLQSQLLLEDLVAPTPDQQETIAEIMQSSAFMGRMIEDLVDASWMRTGQFTLAREPVEVVGFVADLVKLGALLARRKRIAIDYAAPAQPILLDADPARLQQVINNLIGNAIKYSHADTKIQVVVAAAASEVRISVYDQGQGIAPDELDKIFRPFVTTRTHPTAGEKSTGLGLAIVQSIVEAHGGRIDVESQLGEGTSFHVSLPRLDLPAA